MNTKEIKLMIIQNFIDHFTSDEAERQSMKECAAQYVEEDHVDEIRQSKNKHYFLFGEGVCQVFDDEGAKAAKKFLNTEGGALVTWDDGDEPSALLADMDGWNAYMELTEEQYDEIK